MTDNQLYVLFASSIIRETFTDSSCLRLEFLGRVRVGCGELKILTKYMYSKRKATQCHSIYVSTQISRWPSESQMNITNDGMNKNKKGISK